MIFLIRIAMTFFYSSDVFLMFPCLTLWFCNGFLCFFVMVFILFCSLSDSSINVFLMFVLMVCLCFLVFSYGLLKVFFTIPHVLHVGGFLRSAYGSLCSPMSSWSPPIELWGTSGHKGTLRISERMRKTRSATNVASDP